MECIAAARPTLPESLNDRAQDNWELLFGISEAAGGHWPRKAREAALALSAIKNEPATSGEELLRDIQAIFADKAAGCIASVDLVAALVEMSDRPWPEANRGKPITQGWLARKLDGFKVKPKKLRFGAKTPWGYERESLADAFSRYLQPPQTGTPEQPNKINNVEENKSGTLGGDVPLLKSANLSKSLDCSGVPVSNSLFSGNRTHGNAAPSFHDRQQWRDGGPKQNASPEVAEHRAPKPSRRWGIDL